MSFWLAFLGFDGIQVSISAAAMSFVFFYTSLSTPLNSITYGSSSFTNICSFDEIDAIVIDNKLDNAWHESMAERQVEIIESNLQ